MFSHVTVGVNDLPAAAAFYDAVLLEGAPGPRGRYGEGYYGAYLRDPDGNKVHLAWRGDLSGI